MSDLAGDIFSYILAAFDNHRRRTASAENVPRVTVCLCCCCGCAHCEKEFSMFHRLIDWGWHEWTGFDMQHSWRAGEAKRARRICWCDAFRHLSARIRGYEKQSVAIYYNNGHWVADGRCAVYAAVYIDGCPVQHRTQCFMVCMFCVVCVPCAMFAIATALSTRY